MRYQIRWGDTLSGLARRHGTTVNALMQANKYIKDPNLIFAGRTLNIPGRKDSFEAPGSKGGPKSSGPKSQGPKGTGDTFDGPSGSGSGAKALQLARSVLGRNAGELKLSGGAIGKAMQDWVPNNVNCANFVSAILQAAGMIAPGQGSAAVYGLMANLDKDKDWGRVASSSMKPGDVVSMKTNGGQHVVMFAGYKNGRPLYIGSNNVNADGSQRVSYSQMNYPIMAVHRYRG
jgi:hypothetical protein